MQSAPSALASYRSDLPLGAGDTPGSSAEGETLLIASLVRSAVSATSGRTERNRLLAKVTPIARASLGAERIGRGCRYTGGPARSRLDLIRLVAETAEQAGNLRVAQNILDALQLIAERPSDVGHVMADRARNARKRGDVALAAALYEELLRLGRRQVLPELEAAAYIGLGALAQMRGNFARMRTMAKRGLRIASRHQLDRLAATAHSALGVQAALANDLSAAITHLWCGYGLSSGDSNAQQELLANLAHAFLLAGRPEEARSASRTVLHASPPMRIALPALGAFALASAAVRSPDDVAWAEEQVRRLGKSRGHARELASALVDCAGGLEMIGQSVRAEVLRRRAEVLALKHDFFDLTFRATLAVEQEARPRVTLARHATAAALEMEKLQLEVLPSSLELSGVA